MILLHRETGLSNTEPEIEVYVGDLEGSHMLAIKMWGHFIPDRASYYDETIDCIRTILLDKTIVVIEVSVAAERFNTTSKPPIHQLFSLFDMHSCENRMKNQTKVRWRKHPYEDDVNETGFYLDDMYSNIHFKFEEHDGFCP